MTEVTKEIPLSVLAAWQEQLIYIIEPTTKWDNSHLEMAKVAIEDMRQTAIELCDEIRRYDV